MADATGTRDFCCAQQPSLMLLWSDETNRFTFLLEMSEILAF
jgi:hypothetical protein